MKLIYILSFLLFTSCVSHRGTLYIDKSPTQKSQPAGGIIVYNSILSPSSFNKAIRSLERQYSRPIQLVGFGGSIHSYKEYIGRMGGRMPTAVDLFILTDKDIISNMDYKDVWLSKGPPVAIFVTDDIITWRYKDDSLVIFFEGRTVVKVE